MTPAYFLTTWYDLGNKHTHTDKILNQTPINQTATSQTYANQTIREMINTPVCGIA